MESLFLNENHKKLFSEYIRRDNTQQQDRKRQAFFFIFSGCPDLISKDINRIYDFQDHHMKFRPDEGVMEKYLEQFSLCPGSMALLLLAVNLYNSSYGSLSVNDTFSDLDEDNFKLGIIALKIRFEKDISGI